MWADCVCVRQHSMPSGAWCLHVKQQEGRLHSASTYILHAFSFMNKTFAFTMLLLITLYLSEHKILCLFLNQWQVGILTEAYFSVWKAFILCSNWLRYSKTSISWASKVSRCNNHPLSLVLKGPVRNLSDNLEWMKQQHKKPQDNAPE